MVFGSAKKKMTSARDEITNLSPGEAKQKVEDEAALIVDIRELRELKKVGVIPGAVHVPMDMVAGCFDPNSADHKLEFAEDREFIFY